MKSPNPKGRPKKEAPPEKESNEEYKRILEGAPQRALEAKHQAEQWRMRADRLRQGNSMM